MKKIILLVIVALMVNIFTITVMAQADIKVSVNGNNITFPDAKPFIDANNRTLIPVRFVSEALGAKVGWNGDIRQVDITLDTTKVTIKINDKNIVVNSRIQEMDTKAIIKQDRTFVPIRFVSEALGATVKWDGNTRTVIITTGKEKTTGVEPATQDLKEIYNKLYSDPCVFVGRAGGIVNTDSGKLEGNKTNWSINKGDNSAYILKIHKYDNEKAINELEDVLEQFYPTGYKTIFQELKKVIETNTIPSDPMGAIATYYNNFDNRDIDINKFTNGTSLIIGLKE